MTDTATTAPVTSATPPPVAPATGATPPPAADGASPKDSAAPVTREARIQKILEKEGPIGTESEGGEEAKGAGEVSEKAPAAEGSPSEKEETGPLSKQWRALSKQAKSLQKERENFRTLTQEYQRVTQEAQRIQSENQAFREHLQRLNEDPIGTLQALGTSFEAIAQRVIDGGKGIDPQQQAVQQVSQQMSQTQQQIEQLKAEIQKRDAQQRAQQVEIVKTAYHNRVKENAKAEPWLQEWAEIKDVDLASLASQVGAMVYHQTGGKESLTPDQTYALIRDKAKEDYARIKSRLGGVRSEPSAPTLTNRLSAESAGQNRQLSREERMARAAALLNQMDREKK